MSIEYTSEATNFMVDVEPVVTHDSYITFTRGNEEVGRIKAQFDFSTLPDKHHEMGLQMIQRGIMNLNLPSYPTTQKTGPVRIKNKSLVSKLVAWFK